MKLTRDEERQLIDNQINSLFAYAVRDVILFSAVTSGIHFGLYLLHQKSQFAGVVERVEKEYVKFLTN